MKKYFLCLTAMIILLFGGTSYGAQFDISIQGTDGFDIAGITIWLDVDADFALSGSIEKVGIPANWWDDTSHGTLITDSSRRIIKLGASDFFAAAGQPLVPLNSGLLYSFNYSGVINAPFLIQLPDLTGHDYFGDDSFDVTQFDQNTLMISAVPIPSSLILLGGGIFAILGITRRKKRIEL